MPKFGNLVVDQLIVPPVLWFFFIGGAVGAAISVGLILRSAGVLRLFGVVNQSVSTRRLAKPLAIPRDSSALVWRYRWPIAAFFVIGAAYSLYGLIAHANDAAFAASLKLPYPPLAVVWAVESVRLLLILGCSVSVVVGILLAFFPDTMRTIEINSSRWVSVRQMVPDVDVTNMALDNWVAAYPRVAGGLILAPALGVMFYFGALLLS